MRIKLPFLLLCSIGAFAQQPISNFLGVLGAGDGVGQRFYFRGIPTTPVDQTPQGAAASWDFSGVTFNVDHHDYSNLVPSAQTVIDYPGCNFQTEIAEDTPDETARIYANYTNGNFSILRSEGEIMTLDYTINTAFMGQFPMDYGYISSDVVAGNFTYSGTLGEFQGTFSGTVDSSFDGYGTLLYKNDLGVVSSTTVSRLKVTQLTSLSVPFFPDAGNLTQVSYYYYSEDEFGVWPYVRSIDTNLTVPLFDINENMLVLEKGTDTFLGIPSSNPAAFTIYPNPASNVLHVNTQFEIKSVTVFSIDGKKISESAGNRVSIDNLKNGLYMAGIDSGQGIIYKKFIKN